MEGGQNNYLTLKYTFEFLQNCEYLTREGLNKLKRKKNSHFKNWVRRGGGG